MFDLIADIKVHHHLTVDGTNVQEYFSIIKSAKDKIEVLAEYDTRDLFLASEYAGKHPRVVTVAGSCLLHKTRANGQSLEDAIPFYNSIDYYSAEYQDKAKNNVVLAKRKDIDILLEKTSVQNPIVSLVLGEISSFIYLQEDNPNELRGETATISPNYHIESVDGVILDIARTETTQNQAIYASQTVELLNGGFIDGIQLDWIQTNNEDHQFFQKWKKYGLIFVAAWLVILLVNFGVFQSVYSKASVIPDNNLSATEQISQLKSQISKLSNENTTVNGDFALLADLIGTKVPTAVSLKNIELNPLINTEGKTQIVSNTISIVGHSKSSVGINTFVKELKEVSRFRRVNVIYIKKLKSTVEFQLDLDYLFND